MSSAAPVWEVILLEIEGGQGPGPLERPRYRRLGTVQSATYTEAVAVALQSFAQLVTSRETAYDPFYREFPEIDWRALKRRVHYEFFAVSPLDQWRNREQVRAARHQRARALLEQYERPPCRPLEEVPEAVRSLIEIKDECWLWTGPVNERGHGHLWREGQRWLAHRYIYSRLVGDIPSWAVLTQTCTNKHCVRPHHIELVPAQSSLRAPSARAASSC